MIKENISLDEVIEFLNELVRTDPDAMHMLVEHRQSCNKDMAEHRTVQVHDYHGVPKVGLLGILNGMFGINERGWGPITAVYDKFSLSYFERTQDLRAIDE